MCIVSIILNAHADYPLIIVANRDENIWRESLPPELIKGILCTRDAANNAADSTCIGMNTLDGTFCCLTNLGKGGSGDAAQRGLTRGKLVHAFLRDVQSATPLLANKAEYHGFNLVWLNLYEEVPTLFYTTNRFEDGWSGDFTTVDTNRLDCCVTIANDILGDEFVKVPFLENAVLDVLRLHPSKSSKELDLNDARILCEKLGRVMSSSQSVTSPTSLYHWLTKLFHSSQKRRVQPAMKTFLYVGLVSLVLLTLLTCFLLLIDLLSGSGLLLASVVLLAFLAGLLASLRHHTLINRLMVKIDFPPFVQWGTMSQTIILKQRNGELHYFNRDTIEKDPLTNQGTGWLELTRSNAGRGDEMTPTTKLTEKTIDAKSKNAKRRGDWLSYSVLIDARYCVKNDEQS